MLDTDICIYIRKGRPEQVVRRFRTVRPGEAALSVITYGELLYGAGKNELREQSLARLRQLVELVPALPLPEKAAEIYGFIRAELERRGELISNNDLWIAARARAEGAELGSVDTAQRVILAPSGSAGTRRLRRRDCGWQSLGWAANGRSACRKSAASSAE